MDLPAALAAAITSAYASLPKTGKPQPNEHTAPATAGFALALDPAGPVPAPRPPRVVAVALGTGTKCLGGSKRSGAGDALHDSHAEVVARRALLAWLYGEAALVVGQWARGDRQPGGDGSAGGEGGGGRGGEADQGQGQGQGRGWQQPQQQLQRLRLRLRPGLRLLLYVASGTAAEPAAASLSAAAAAAGFRFRTGAKAIKLMAPPTGPGASETATAAAAAGGPGAVGDAAAGAAGGGSAAQVQARDVDAAEQHAAAGSVRRKPGRGDATLSLSCSDKIARWCCLGVQGALLSGLLAAPLRLDVVAVGATPAMERAAGLDAAVAAVADAARRAFHSRLAADAAAAGRLPPPYGLQPPHVAAMPPPPGRLGLSPDASRK
ncbi:tRNA-specific adenosine deaminase 1, partial [Tetrabaena socialis]